MMLMLVLLDKLHLKIADQLSFLHTPTDVPDDKSDDDYNDNQGDHYQKVDGLHSPSGFLHVKLLMVE